VSSIFIARAAIKLKRSALAGVELLPKKAGRNRESHVVLVVDAR